MQNLWSSMRAWKSSSGQKSVYFKVSSLKMGFTLGRFLMDKRLGRSNFLALTIFVQVDRVDNLISRENRQWLAIYQING